jgi:hypothetical protein
MTSCWVYYSNKHSPIPKKPFFSSSLISNEMR